MPERPQQVLRILLPDTSALTAPFTRARTSDTSRGRCFFNPCERTVGVLASPEGVVLAGVDAVGAVSLYLSIADNPDDHVQIELEKLQKEFSW